MTEQQKKNIREAVIEWGEQAIEEEYMPVIMVCMKMPDKVMVCRADDAIDGRKLKPLLRRLIESL